jgi:hypothetical protein
MESALSQSSLPPVPASISDWRSWSPHLLAVEDPPQIIKRTQEACAFLNAQGTTLVSRHNVGSLNTLAWKGVDILIRERCFSLVRDLAVDGHMMRAHMNGLYPHALALTSWERLFSEPSTITTRSQLMENVRIMLFYMTTLPYLGHNQEAEELQPLLDLALVGLLPLGLDPRGSKLIVITG